MYKDNSFTFTMNTDPFWYVQLSIAIISSLIGSSVIVFVCMWSYCLNF